MLEIGQKGGGTLIVERTPWPLVEGILEALDVSDVIIVERVAFGYELADKTVGVFVGAAFPWRVWVGVVDVGASNFGKFSELTPIVEGDGLEIVRTIVIED